MDKIKSIPNQWKELVNDDQKRAIEHIYGPLLIIAGAGSGKTRVLTYRYAHLVKNYSISFEKILAITFLWSVSLTPFCLHFSSIILIV